MTIAVTTANCNCIALFSNSQRNIANMGGLNLPLAQAGRASTPL